MTLTLGETLNGVIGLSKEAALEYLKKNKSPTLWMLLGATVTPQVFDRSILEISWKVSDLPVGLTVTNLHKEVKKLDTFKITSKVQPERKKLLLIQVLESLDKTESGILFSILSGTFYNRYSNLDPTSILNLITLS